MNMSRERSSALGSSLVATTGITPSTGTPAACCASAEDFIERSRKTTRTSSAQPTKTASAPAIIAFVLMLGDTGDVGLRAGSSGLAYEVSIVEFMRSVSWLVDRRLRRML